MISNGGTLPWKGKIRNLWISIGDYNLHSKMFSLPLGGCDVVFGSQWLPTLWPILWDFAKLWMQFSVMGKSTHWRDYNQGLSTSSVHIAWKISLEELTWCHRSTPLHSYVTFSSLNYSLRSTTIFGSICMYFFSTNGIATFQTIGPSYSNPS